MLLSTIEMLLSNACNAVSGVDGMRDNCAERTLFYARCSERWGCGDTQRPEKADSSRTGRKNAV